MNLHRIELEKFFVKGLDQSESDDLSPSDTNEQGQLRISELSHLRDFLKSLKEKTYYARKSLRNARKILWETKEEDDAITFDLRERELRLATLRNAECRKEVYVQHEAMHALHFSFEHEFAKAERVNRLAGEELQRAFKRVSRDQQEKFKMKEECLKLKERLQRCREDFLRLKASVDGFRHYFKSECEARTEELKEIEVTSLPRSPRSFSKQNVLTRQLAKISSNVSQLREENQRLKSELQKIEAERLLKTEEVIKSAKETVTCNSEDLTSCLQERSLVKEQLMSYETLSDTKV